MPPLAKRARHSTQASAHADWAIPILSLQDIGDGQLWLPAAAPEPVTTPAPNAPAGIQVGNVHSNGGPIALGGPITDNRQTTTRHGGIEFHGSTTINGPTVGGDVDSLIYNASALPVTQPSPPHAAPSPDLAAQLDPAYSALTDPLEDAQLLEQVRELRLALLEPQPDWKRLVGLRDALAATPALAEPVKAFFADPTVTTLMQGAKRRWLRGSGD